MEQKQRVLSYFSTYSPPELRHLSYRGINFFVSCVVEVCRLGLEPLWHSSPSLCHSENAEANRTGISWGVRKYGNLWARGPGYRVDDDYCKHLPVELLAGDVLTVEPCVAIDLAHLTMNFNRRYALCIQKNYHRPHFTVGVCRNKSLQYQPLRQCYCENWRSTVSACVMRRRYPITYTQSLHAINGLIAVGRVGNLLCGRPSYYTLHYVCIYVCTCECVCATWV